MIITSNKRFRLLLKEYDLPDDISFHIPIPEYVQNEIIEKEISAPEPGMTSFDEDDDNHFHVDWYIEPPDNKKAFMLGIKTLLLLAEKFEKHHMTGMRFWFHFETPELTEQWAIARKVHKEGDEYYTSDRLSFHTRRPGEEVISIDPEEETFNALLTIDI